MASKKAKVIKGMTMYAVIPESDYPFVKDGDLCDVMLLGWNPNYAKAVSDAKAEAKYDYEGENLVVLEVTVNPQARLIPVTEPDYREEDLYDNGY
jgi:hypothetical protein